jgi:hypothetical protein
VPRYERTLEERAQHAVRHLPKKEQAQVLQACRALDQVGRRDGMGRAAMDEGRLKAAFKTHEPASFVDGFFEEFRRRSVANAPADAEVMVSDSDDDDEVMRSGRGVSWIELGAAVSPFDDLPADETMEAFGLTAQSSNEEVLRVIKRRLPDFPDAAFEGEETARRVRRGMERLGNSPSRTTSDGEGVPTQAAGFSWADFFYCMKDRWLEWLILSVATLIFILMVTGFNWAVALTLAVIYVPFWAVVIAVGCIFWALS